MLRYWLCEAAEVAASYHSAIGCFRLNRVASVICKRNIGCCNWEIDAVANPLANISFSKAS